MRKTFTALLLAIFMAPHSTKAESPLPSLQEVKRNSETVNDLSGAFGIKFNWDQYIDPETRRIQISFNGQKYGWKDIHGRLSYFLHTDLRRDAAERGLEVSEMPIDEYSRVSFFLDDHATIYAAGWRNFRDDRASVFTVAEVDSRLFGNLDRDAPRSGLTKSQVQELISRSPGFALVYQDNSEFQRGFDPKLGYQVNSDYPYKVTHFDGLRRTSNYMFPREARSEIPKLSPNHIRYLEKLGCVSENDFDSLFVSPLALGDLGFCFFDTIEAKAPNMSFPGALIGWLDSRVEKNIVAEAPSLNMLSDAQLMRRPEPGDGAVRTMWSSFAGEQCRRRNPSKGDWIVLQYKDRAGALSSVRSFDEKRLSNFATEFFGLAGWLPRNSGKFSFGSGKCPFPITLTIYVYHGDKLMGSATLDNDYAQKHLKSPNQGISVSTAMNSWEKFEQFLVNEVGALIWYYAENFR